MTSHTRIFYALWPEQAETLALAAACRTLFPLSGRPVDPRDLHVTLAFIGHVRNDRLDAFLGLAGPIDPVVLEFDQLEHWPKSRTLVATMRQVPEVLRTRVDELWRRLDRLGVARDPRPFRPHVTLAREVAQWHIGRRWTPVTWRTDRIRLIESRSDRLPRYAPLDGPESGR